MRIFVTGATGFIGAAVVNELIKAKHLVIGLSRSPEKSKALKAAGVEVLEGTIENDDILRQGAAQSDGVIHLAFNHDFSNFAANCLDDRRVIKALGLGLEGSSRPLLVTSGVPIAKTIPGEPAKENNAIVSSSKHPRAHTEEAALELEAKGINVSVVRLPQVHDTRKQGLVTPVIDIYRAEGACAYVGDGQVNWPAAHVLDVARLYRLAVERAEPNAKYHAVAEEGIPMRDIAETLAARLKLPAQSISKAEAPAFFGWLTLFADHDMRASSALTRKVLGWNPTGPGLLADLEKLELPAR